MQKATRNGEPSRQSLRVIPEIDFSRLRRGRRGTYSHLLAGEATHAVVIDSDLWHHFGSAPAVNAALRLLVDVAAKTRRKKTPRKAVSRRAA